MASFFTVNVALHFLFNWKIEKSKYSPIRVSSEYSRKSSVFRGIVTRASYFNRRSSTSIAPDVGGNAPRRSTLQRAPSAQGMEGSRHGDSAQHHHIQPLSKQASFKTGITTKNTPPRNGAFQLTKAASDNNISLQGNRSRISNLNPNAAKYEEEVKSNSNHSPASTHEKGNHDKIYEEKNADEIGESLTQSSAINENRKLRKYGSTRSLMSLPEELSKRAYANDE